MAGLRREIADLQPDRVMEGVFKLKGALMWLIEKARSKYPVTSLLAGETLIHFPSSCEVECAFRVVNNSVDPSRNRLELTKRADLRLKPTSIDP